MIINTSSFVKTFALSIKLAQHRKVTNRTDQMTSATSYNVFIPNDVIPTAETKIKLADSVLIAPLG
jgi:hypothetical protein